jgi:SAM-dependent methyltransferase
MKTDEHWEHFAQHDPYWAVLVHEKFLSANLTDEARAEFFASGEAHIGEITRVLQRHFDAPSRFQSALDLGCGVGRLLLPLARISDTAYGIDISDTMRKVCAQNAEIAGLRNVILERTVGAGPPVELITSFIVLQHIPIERGREIIRDLVRRLSPGGFGYLHFTLANEITMINSEAENTTGAKYGFYQRIGDGILRLVGEIRDEPIMQMNHYNLNEIICILYQHGVGQHFSRITNHGGVIGIELFFRR